MSVAQVEIQKDENLPVCITCGLQWSSESPAPKTCPICLDDRQWVPDGGTVWSSLREYRISGRRNEFLHDRDDPNIIFIKTFPHTGIGQTPKLMKTASGYILIECMSYVDVATIETIQKYVAASGLPFLGIAISHPHWYNTSSTWARALGGCPIYAHALDKEWWFRPERVGDVTWWEGETLSIGGEATMILCGGHFPGACVTHVDRKVDGKGGFLAAADIIMISQSSERRQAAFMYSYPNYIPLAPEEVVLIWQRVKPFEFSDSYGAWPDRRMVGGAKETIFGEVFRQLKKQGVKDPAGEFVITMD